MDAPKSYSWKYIFLLALAACLILGVGWLVRPREIASSPAPLPTESELTQLSRRAERRSLDEMATYFAVTASDLGSSIVHFPGTGSSGVAWSDGTIVTAPLLRYAAESITVQSGSGEVRVQPTIWGPRLPLSVLATASGLPGLSTVRHATSRPNAGSWVLAVWRAGREPGFASGAYIQSAQVTCGLVPVQEVVSSLALTRMMVGGGLFDIDGSLLAVILSCDNRVAAIATPSIAAILAQSGTDEQRVLARYGLVLEALAEHEPAYFKIDSGVIVREVWSGHRGDEAGLMPGDIIGALNGEAVATPGDLAALAGPPGEKALELRVRRGSTTLTIALAGNDVAHVPGTPAAPGAGLVWESPAERYRIERVIPGSRAAMAGIEPGDRLVRVDHAEPRSLVQVQRILGDDGASPVLLEIERDGRRLAIVLR